MVVRFKSLGPLLALPPELRTGLEVCYCLWGVPSRPSPGSYPGPVQVPSRVRGGPVQIRHVLCFTVFRTHPGPEVGAIPARPGPILLPSVPYRIGPGRAETDFLATSDCLLPTPPSNRPCEPLNLCKKRGGDPEFVGKFLMGLV